MIDKMVNTQRSNIRNVVANRVVDVVPMNEGRIVGGVMADRMVHDGVNAQRNSVCNAVIDRLVDDSQCAVIGDILTD